MQYLPYLLETLLISLVFFSGYKVLKKWSGFASLRIYLILAIFSMAVLPLVSIEIKRSESLAVTPVPDLLISEPIEELFDTEESIVPASPMDEYQKRNTSTPINWLWTIFFSGVIFLSVRFLLGLFRIFKLRKLAIRRSGYFEVNHPRFIGASFFGWIFIGNHIPENQREIIRRHELIHARLLHSVDKLLVEITTIFLWWNPICWYFRRQISVNAEYEVDQLMTERHNRKAYADFLLQAVSGRSFSPVFNHFALSNIRTRIVLLSETRGTSNMAVITGFLLLITLFGLVSCRIEEDRNPAETFSGIKSIRSHFISHQNDTQQKDGKTIATVNFLPDGTVDEYVQHLTYPYDMAHGVKKTFWAHPEAANLPYIMDGLDVSEAEHQLLYGNGWPALYAENLAKKRDITDFYLRNGMEIDNPEKPTLISSKSPEWSMKVNGKMVKVSSSYSEIFEYNKELVTQHRKENLSPMMAMRGDEEKMTKGIISKVEFEYDELDRITAVKTHQGAEHHFFYEDDRLIKTEFLVRGKKYSTRYYFYEDGLNVRTEIYNVHDQKEYTILYDYEYYDTE